MSADRAHQGATPPGRGQTDARENREVPREAREGPQEARHGDGTATADGKRRAVHRLTARTTGPFAEWAHQVAEWAGLPLAEVIHQALLRFAEQSGYTVKPPRRICYRRGLGRDRAERRDAWLAGEPGFKRLENDPEL